MTLDETTREGEARLAYVAVIGNEKRGGRLGVAVENEAGYHPTDITFPTYQDAVDVAEMMNERLGLTPKEAALIVASSMRKDAPRGKVSA